MRYATNGNLYEEVGVLAERRTDGTEAIQSKDFKDHSTTATIFPQTEFH